MTRSPTAPRAGRQPAYGEQARSYDRDTGTFQPYRRELVEALPLRRGQVVLDVGCGTGLCCGLLRDKVGPRGGVIGIEESPEMAAVALEQITREGWRNVTVVRSSAEDAQIGVTADAALFCAVHDILQSPGALRNVLARLRPGAWVAAGGGKWASPLLAGVNHGLVAARSPAPTVTQPPSCPARQHASSLTSQHQEHRVVSEPSRRLTLRTGRSVFAARAQTARMEQ
jgi:trans-aconitate methyltransferase